MAVTSLRLVIPSDLHDDVAALELLAKEVAAEHIDVVLCPGDFSTMPNAVARGDANWAEPSAEDLQNFEVKTGAVIQALKQIRPSARLIFVPGNHDPPPMFEATGTEQGDGNVHGRVADLAPDLVVAGWGGCVEAKEDGREVWNAYPWREASLDGAGLGQLAEGLGKLPPTTRVVLLTHFGPESSSTTRVTGTDPNSLHAPGLRDALITSGSAALQAALVAPDAMQRRVALQVHGHTHQGCGLARVGAVPVLNPGSLKYTRTYALVTLGRAAAAPGQPWTLASCEIRTLGAGAPPA
mmetsp:Transcript_113681/g.321894  ORF Transcript_113681/g.321894 Transcript_113681/m.321894 type:complete len:296 (-) Transcript_113681:282-1169(-)